jgi:limonene-1,2-epoxide hydrolase
MSDPISIVKQLNKAFETKNVQAYKSLLHPRYTFSGPCMKAAGPDEAAAMLNECPMKGHTENLKIVASGNDVVQIFDWVVSEPFQATIRMANYLTLQDGKVLREEIVFDTAKFPAEFVESMKAQATA